MRFLIQVLPEDDYRGNFYLVEAPSEASAFDLVLLDHGADGDISILGTRQQVEALLSKFDGVPDYKEPK